MDIGIYANPNYYFQYDNPDFQALMEELNETTDPAARSALLGKAQRMISEDYVNGYLFELAVATVAKAGLQGLWVNQPTAAVDLTAVSWGE
jgi:peptide/nickel transport system substrate-binding protein